MRDYWIIPMDFKQCNFEELENEWIVDKKIMWKANGMPQKRKRTNTWYINKNDTSRLLKKGDVIYFYVTNLPTNSDRYRLSRILLRGVVEEEATPVEYNKVYKLSQRDDMIIGFAIGKITTLPKLQLENDTFLSREKIESKFSDFKYPQGVRWPNTAKGTLNEEIVKMLEEIFKSNSTKDDFKNLIDHFNKKCYFCGKIGNKGDHRTFKRRNGMDYYEIHHFIQQHKIKSNKIQSTELEMIIESPENKVCLCSNCHNQIHYGRKENVNKMIRLLWDDENIQNMLQKYNFTSIVGDRPLEWIKSTYNV